MRNNRRDWRFHAGLTREVGRLYIYIYIYIAIELDWQFYKSVH